MTVMTKDELTGCPAEEHVRWLVRVFRPGVPLVTDAEIQQHFEVEAQDLPARIHGFAGGPGVRDVRGWRTSPTGDVVVEYVSVGGRNSELIAPVGPSGRLGMFRFQPALDGIDVTVHPTADLAVDARRGIHDVFDRSYHDGDHRYVDNQLQQLDTVALAWKDGAVVAFSISGQTERDLPVLGRLRVGLVGMFCTHPDIRRGGLMLAVGSAGIMSRTTREHISAGRMATPATLKSAIKTRAVSAWPTATDPLVLYRESTPTQRAVGRALAAAHGVEEFDDEHFVCIGNGRPVGTPIVEIDAEAEHWAPFSHVDRSRGDTLLFINFPMPPPAEWFT